jgi:hypothetical protein
MKVKLIYEPQLSWTITRVVELQTYVTDEDIKALFPIKLGVTYNEDNCNYEVLEGKIVDVPLEEMLAYTE